jgi:outer membrane protein assembly factor BamB
MRNVIALGIAAAALTGGRMLADSERSSSAPSATPTAQAPSSDLIDYWTDGADIERSGWVKNEKILTKANVGTLKLKWKLETGNQPRALHGLMPVLVIGQLATSAGVKQVGIVNGISDNLYAFDVETGKILWQKHWDYEAPPGAGGGGGGAAQQDPRRLGFLRPGGSSDTPVIGPADAQGRRPLYFVTGDGMLHTLNAADGSDLQPPFKFFGGKGWALNLAGNTLWLQTTYAGASIAAVRLDDPEKKVMTWNAGSGGAWGRRGVAVDSTGTAWTTTGDGVYDLTSDPKRYANSVVGVQIDNGQMKLKDYYTPTNWEWLRKRDLDPNNTPTIFKYKGRELIAASGKECRLYLLDPESAGGENHQTPAYKTSLFCNEEVDFQDMGSWGALSSWEDTSGTRWVLAPFWGPVHSQAKFPISYGPVKEGGVAAYKLVERGGKLEFAPAWVSRDMKRGEPVLIVNGMVIGYGSGEETKQAWPDIGLQFDSSIRAAKGTRATIYVLDAITGKELWSSGDQIHQWNHFSGVTAVNGRIYLSTYEGTLYCFGVDSAATATK